MRLPIGLHRSRRVAGGRKGRPRVEQVERRLLLASAVFLVETAADDGPGSLRWAIGQINAEPADEPGTIRFAIPGAGPATIRPASPLDPITRPVFIEARAADGSPTVRVDGSAAGRGVDGLVVAGGGSVVAGLIVTGFTGAGIVLTGAGGSFVEACYVGLVPGAGGSAPTAAPNGTGILIASASSQTIGGPDGRGNVIAGNRGAGVMVASAEPGDAARNAIVGNRIGTDAAGTAEIGNGGDGVVLAGATSGRVEDNVISGNQSNGVVLSHRAEGNRLTGNIIGLTPDGTRRLGNRRDGILVVDAPGNAIGGPAPRLGNQISGNGGAGVRARGESDGLTIRGNWIGVDPTGLVRRGNDADGVSVSSDGVTVGGPEARDGNVIAFNGQGAVGAGVQVVGSVHGVSILSNRIFANAGLGINLGNGPATPRTPPASQPTDAVGPNDWINQPILSTSFADGVTLKAQGRVWGMPGQTYTVQFFWTSAPDPSGNGEGERYLGRTQVTTDSRGDAAFSLPMAADVAGGFLSATSTDEYGNTSEFAQTVSLRPYTDLHVEMTADPPSARRGAPITFTATVSNRGFVAAPGVVLTVAPPAGSRVEIVSAGATTAPGGAIRLAVGSLSPGATAVLTVVAWPADGFSGVYQAFATATMTMTEARPGDETASASAVVAGRDSSNMGVAAAVETASVIPGSNATYRFRARNEGPTAEPAAVLTLALPPGATVVSADSARGPATIANGLAVFLLGELAPGEEVEATLVLTADAPGPLRVIAMVGGLNQDEDRSNQRATAIATVVAPVDMATYVDPPPAAFERAEFRYTLTAANLSDRAATGARLTAPLPAGVEFVSAVASQGGTPILVGRDLVADLGTIAAGGRATVTITVRAVATAGATLLLSGVSTSDLPDTAPGNDRGGYAVEVRPAVDLMLRLRPLTPSVDLGADVTWVVEVWNSSLTTASGVTIAVPYLPAGAYVGSSATQGTVTASGGVFTAAVGTLAPRGHATIAFILRPTSAGTATLTAAATADQHVNLTTSGVASANLSVIEPSGAIAFAAPGVVVPETAGAAYLTVVRTDGARGAVSVRYRTTAGTAAPGVDYRPTTGVVTFQPGQTSAVIAVPVLAYAHNRGDVSVGVVLEAPTGGATLGQATAATLVIQDVDPDFSPPSVARLRLLGSAAGIATIALTLSEAANAASALDGRAYALYDLGPSGVLGDGDDTPIPLQPPGYDAATRTIYLSPAVFLAPNRHYAVGVHGAGPTAVVDTAGNPLAGGVGFVGLFARGTSLRYADANGDAVSLALRSGGFLDLVRAASGDAIGLSLHEIVPGRSTLTGSVTRPRGRGGDGVTPLGVIEGLGSFGDVRVSLRTPPFLASGFPTPAPRAVRPGVTPVRVAPPLRRFPSPR
ncbi:Calx-beta domain-containing protein [Paludisphaera sp.]|uniref:Calx-beta domain-containing protein n=1 Tax=Paludisphaera sp. TaxID=2017432 RepID=UPI00301C1E32